MDTLGAMVAGLAAVRCLRSHEATAPAHGTRLARQSESHPDGIIGRVKMF